MTSSGDRCASSEPAFEIKLGDGRRRVVVTAPQRPAVRRLRACTRDCFWTSSRAGICLWSCKIERLYGAIPALGRLILLTSSTLQTSIAAGFWPHSHSSCCGGSPAAWLPHRGGLRPTRGAARPRDAPCVRGRRRHAAMRRRSGRCGSRARQRPPQPKLSWTTTFYPHPVRLLWSFTDTWGKFDPACARLRLRGLVLFAAFSSNVVVCRAYPPLCDCEPAAARTRADSPAPCEAVGAVRRAAGANSLAARLVGQSEIADPTAQKCHSGSQAVIHAAHRNH